MSAAENTADMLKELPHMTEEHLATLRKHGLTTPERLLEALNNPPKWAAIHAELKGIGPKTADIWRLFLESDQWAKPDDKPAKVEKATEAPKPQQQAVRVARQVKKPGEVKVEPAVPKPEPVAKKIEPVREPAIMRGKAPEKAAAEKPKVEAKVAPAVPKPEPVEKKIEPVPVEEKAPEKAAPAKPKAKAAKKGEPKAKAKKEALEVVEEGGYMPSKKPKLSPEVVDALKKRSKVAETRPEFTRQEYGRRLRLQQTGWRKPKGIHSKARYKMRYRRPMVSIGYGGPKLTKNYHPSGFREVHVFNVADLAKISDADKQAARIGHGVGRRKRELMIKKADELGIRVLNRR